MATRGKKINIHIRNFIQNFKAGEFILVHFPVIITKLTHV
jgi:hypothetical protein